MDFIYFIYFNNNKHTLFIWNNKRLLYKIICAVKGKESQIKEMGKQKRFK